MLGTARLGLVLTLGCLCGSMAAALAAAAPEWNPVRPRTAAIGPQANRFVVGFRATASNALAKTIKSRSKVQSARVVQAQTSAADAAGLAQRRGVAIARSRQLTPSMHVLYLTKTIYGAGVNAALEALRSDSSVEFADVDERRYPHAMPNDPLFVPTPGASGQWYLQTPSSTTATSDAAATDAVSAWTITTGSSGTVIADVDTGVRFDHPDLLRAGFGGRLLPGYDFVDQDYDATSGTALGTFLIANDGDGWDPDPSDPGDWINSADRTNADVFPSDSCDVADSTWHGTRVMGILGAITNDELGIAGMTWNPYLLPVRALGKCGGFDSDIITGIQWAVGLPVENVPDNPYPADIVNLSLGGTGSSCPSDYRSTIDTLTAMGVLVVASAGNESGPVDVPANCAGVLGVAGLRNVGTKTGYSNLGPEVGIAAPAGNCVNSSGPCLRSIDTTVNTGLTVPAGNSYSNQINMNLGTSFSAPIVSAVAALMRAVNANLTPPQLIQRMQAGAAAFPQPPGLPQCPAAAADGSGECACVRGQCGAGMVNALGAVRAAQRPIAAVAPGDTGTTFDAGGSAASCGRTIASYAWTATGGIVFDSPANAARVTLTPESVSGTLTLTVTDSAGDTDIAAVEITPDGASSAAPASAGTSAGACPASMTVVPVPPTVTAAFSPASVGQNDPSTLTLTFENTNSFALTQAAIAQSLPANLTIAASPAPQTTCTGASLSLANTATSVSLVNADIPADGSCSIALSVSSPTAGTYTHTIAAAALSTGPAGGNIASAAAKLTVTAPSKGGGGDLDWLDMMFVTGVLLAGRRYRGRPPR